MMHAPKIAAHIKHLMNNLHKEKHSHRIGLALLKLNIVFETTK